MAKKKLRLCRSGKDFKQYCAKQEGVEIVEGKGSHFKIKTGKGTVIAPCHNKQLGKGLWSVIVKGLVAIGVTSFIAVVISGM